MKSLFLGVLLIVVLGVGGFVYRNAVERPAEPIACALDAKVCPDGTAVSRAGVSCTFPECPPPNVSLESVSIAFSVPEGFVSAALPDAASVAAYEMPIASSTASIIIRRYPILASSGSTSSPQATALAIIRQTAIGVSGKPVSATSFSSTMIGVHRFTIVSIERFEGVIDTAYYLARGTDVLRFDAVDRQVEDWTDPNLDPADLPAARALEKLLSTLQNQQN